MNYYYGFNSLTKEEISTIQSNEQTSLKTRALSKRSTRKLKRSLNKVHTYTSKLSNETIRLRTSIELDLLQLNKFEGILYNALVYRYKRLNIAQANYFKIFIREFSIREYKDVCYLIAKTTPLEFELNEKKELALTKKTFVRAYKSLSSEIEICTNVSRKKKQIQAFSNMANVEDVADVLSYSTFEDTQINGILKLEILEYIRTALTPAQIKTLQSYILDGTKLDTRNKKRIQKRLATDELYNLIKGVIY